MFDGDWSKIQIPTVYKREGVRGEGGVTEMS